MLGNNAMHSNTIKIYYVYIFQLNAIIIIVNVLYCLAFSFLIPYKHESLTPNQADWKRKAQITIFKSVDLFYKRIKLEDNSAKIKI